MATELVLHAGDDHVARLAHEGDPLRAVIELIWNAIDAESDNVVVELERDEWDAIAKTTVTDDGHGITIDELEPTFGHIGASWKRLATTTKNNKRGLHGKLGEGRLRIFALGSRVEWSSVAADTTGALHRVVISGSAEHRQRFPWESEPADDGTTTGTAVTAWNESQKALTALENDNTLSTLLAHFAPVLLNEENLSITYAGTILDPNDDIDQRTTVEFEFGEGATKQTAKLQIIEWKSSKHRTIHYGPDDDHFLYEESARDLEPGFRYSAYVSWPGLDQDAASQLTLGELALGDVAGLQTAVRTTIREHFNRRRLERRREQVKKWKTDKVYPYEGEPKTETERVERAVFDVVSGTLSNQISSTKRDARLTLVLLQSALKAAPESLQTILHEVVALNDADRQALTDLLGEVTLPAIIKAANLVTNRNKFLVGLQHLLFDPEDSDKVGERDHLHRILEQELWVFGEAYNAMSSERGLTEMLRNHLRLEGLPTKGIQPVKKWDGTSGRTDLHLAAKSKEFDRVHHLVVELKAPGVTLGRAELDQVEDYANVVLENAAFASDSATWDFVLVGTDWNDVVDRRLTGERRATGLFHNPDPESGHPNVRAYVRRWSDVIDENKRRLDFMTSTLEHDPSLQEGLGQIRTQYADFLPTDVANEDEER